MLVVIPFCAKDESLALKNIEVCKHLEKNTDYTCLLAHDRLSNPDSMSAACAGFFKGVETFCYEPWQGDPAWPRPQNWAWQSIARFVHQKYPNQHWFWWEADAVPLQSGWLKRVDEEYQAGKNPFMGNIVRGMGHMNGVAVYPWNVAEYSYNAMLVQNSPWDMAMKDDTIKMTHPANHLIAHHPRFNGIQLSFVDKAALDELRKRGAVIFHGCNDGTLQELVLGKKPKATTGGGRSFFIKEDIDREFDESEPFWQQESARLEQMGQDILDYRECRKQVMPFTAQTAWPCGQFPLALNYHCVHFNAGLTRGGSGRLWLLARRWDRQDHIHWHSTLQAFQLDEKLNIISQQEIRPLNWNSEQHEDARVIWHDGRFWVSYCSWIRTPNYSPRQYFSCFDSNWRFERAMRIAYGVNGLERGGCEKNWVWFNQDGVWHFVYAFSPHTVIRVNSEQQLNEYKTPAKAAWKYGEIRGGTPPVRIGDEYFSFFHSSLPWKGRQKRYYMGFYSFSAKTPYRVLRMTNEPLLAGSEHDTRVLGSPLVIFPCGAIFENGEWLVTFGVNDEAVGWIKIPHDDLEKRMEVVCSLP